MWVSGYFIVPSRGTGISVLRTLIVYLAEFWLVEVNHTNGASTMPTSEVSKLPPKVENTSSVTPRNVWENH